jgi:hypothetical protein
MNTKPWSVYLNRAACASLMLLLALPANADNSDNASGWTLVNARKFNPQDSALKGQGISFNPQNNEVVFSGNTGLERTDLRYDSLGKNALALRDLPGSAKPSHIGCIDIQDGVLYAPVEDGAKDPKYQHPLFAQYDPVSLAYLNKVVQLNTAYAQDDGVPWVAADDTYLYTSKAYDVNQINVYDKKTIGDYAYPTPPERAREIMLLRTITKVQCAKVKDGRLYVLSDDDDKWLRSVNLDTGEVRDVLRLKESFQSVDKDGEWEAEGVAFFPGQKDSMLHVTAILRKKLTVQLFVLDFKQN